MCTRVDAWSLLASLPGGRELGMGVEASVGLATRWMRCLKKLNIIIR